MRSELGDCAVPAPESTLSCCMKLYRGCNADNLTEILARRKYVAGGAACGPAPYCRLHQALRRPRNSAARRPRSAPPRRACRMNDDRPCCPSCSRALQCLANSSAHDKLVTHDPHRLAHGRTHYRLTRATRQLAKKTGRTLAATSSNFSNCPVSISPQVDALTNRESLAPR